MKKLLLLLSLIILVAAGCGKQANSYSECVNFGGKLSGAVASAQCEYHGKVFVAPPQVEMPSEASIQIRQKVEGDMGDSLFNIYPSEQKTALDLLKMGHQVETKTFKGAGEYVTSVNGQKEEKGKKFWAFYLNGAQSNVGASAYKPVNKDFIEWKLEEIKK